MSWWTRFQTSPLSNLLITGMWNACSWFPPLWATQWVSRGLGLTREQHKQMCTTHGPINGDGTHHQRETSANLPYRWTRSIWPAPAFSLAPQGTTAWAAPIFPPGAKKFPPGAKNSRCPPNTATNRKPHAWKTRAIIYPTPAEKYIINSFVTTSYSLVLPACFFLLWNAQHFYHCHSPPCTQVCTLHGLRNARPSWVKIWLLVCIF